MMTTGERYFFPQSERLCLQKEIDQLFNAGQSILYYTLRVIYLPFNAITATDSAISMMVSVPKKHIKHAVNRNCIKRLIRESFRLNKNEISALFKQNGKHLNIAYIYICKEVKTFTVINKAVLKAFEVIRRNENKTS